MNSTTNREQERLMREKELAFFGTVTASISHELNNAVATIEQTAGLLEDLTIDCAGSQPIEKEQVRKIAERIGKQTKRGAAIIKRLNAFAHSIDEPERELELNDIMGSVVELARRVADRKRIPLETHPGKGRLTIRNSPFRVQQALYLSIKAAVSITPEGNKVTLSAIEQDSTARILVESDCNPRPGEIDLSFLEILMGRIGGRIESTIKDSRVSIGLIFPPQNDILKQ